MGVLHSEAMNEWVHRRVNVSECVYMCVCVCARVCGWEGERGSECMYYVCSGAQ